jgi:hypothetical protein
MDRLDEILEKAAQIAIVPAAPLQTEFFMCKTDFFHELQDCASGAKVYSDIEDLRRGEPCVSECGIVKIKIELLEVVQPTDYSGLGK